MDGQVTTCTFPHAPPSRLVGYKCILPLPQGYVMNLPSVGFFVCVVVDVWLAQSKTLLLVSLMCFITQNIALSHACTEAWLMWQLWCSQSCGKFSSRRLSSAGVSLPKDSLIVWMHIPVFPSLLSQALIVLPIYEESFLKHAVEVVCVPPKVCTMYFAFL